MKANIVKAKFIGNDGSLGYRKGKTYMLYVFQMFFGSTLKIEAMDGRHRPCPYRNLEAFLRNWRPM